jgi:hypothetical protein
LSRIFFGARLGHALRGWWCASARQKNTPVISRGVFRANAVFEFGCGGSDFAAGRNGRRNTLRSKCGRLHKFGVKLLDPRAPARALKPCRGIPFFKDGLRGGVVSQRGNVSCFGHHAEQSRMGHPHGTIADGPSVNGRCGGAGTPAERAYHMTGRFCVDAAVALGTTAGMSRLEPLVPRWWCRRARHRPRRGRPAARPNRRAAGVGPGAARAGTCGKRLFPARFL